MHAIELPTIPEGSMADRVLKTGGTLMELCGREGVANAFVNGNRNMAAAGGQFAVPIWITKDTLCRMELNPVYIDLPTNLLKSQTSTEGVPLFKIGVSGRRIINSEFIVGGYTFADFLFGENPTSTSWIKNSMINFGGECIWPRYVTVAGDVVFNPQNLFGHHAKRFYQWSTKIGFTKPYILDAFITLSRVKYPDYLPWTQITIFGKFRAPIKKWRIQKWISVGVGATYDNSSGNWRDKTNLRFSLYLQINAITAAPQNTFKDYLRIPIDRYYAIPYHPGVDPKTKKLAIHEKRDDTSDHSNSQEYGNEDSSEDNISDHSNSQEYGINMKDNISEPSNTKSTTRPLHKKRSASYYNLQRRAKKNGSNCSVVEPMPIKQSNRPGFVARHSENPIPKTQMLTVPTLKRFKTDRPNSTLIRELALEGAVKRTPSPDI
jgi:hypothetical protein